MQFAYSWQAKIIIDENSLATPSGPARNFEYLSVVDGLWSRFCNDVGWMDALRSSASPETFLSSISQYGEQMLEDMKKLSMSSGLSSSAETSPRILVIADDVCSRQGWIVDEALVTDVLMPLYGKMITIAANELPVVADELNIRWAFHSDGDISSAYAAVKLAGFDFVHLASIDYVSLSGVAHKAKTQGLIPIGGIAAETLDSGVLSDDLCRKIALVAHTTGLIVGDDAGVSTREQVERLFDACTRIALY